MTGRTRVLVALLVAIVTAPFVPLVINRGFTVAATGIVPTATVGLWFSLSAQKKAGRVGWFLFAAVMTISLVAGPWWVSTLHDAAAYAQDHVSHATFQYVESLSVLALFFLPWITACLVAGLAAILATLRLAEPKGQEPDPQAAGDHWLRYSSRQMLSAFAIVAVVLSTLSSAVSRWDSSTERLRDRFLNRFVGSFAAGRTTLVADPEISPLDPTGFNHPGCHVYRVVAPIRRDGMDTWAAWTYELFEDRPDAVSRFAYAAAPTQAELPPSPGPLLEYLYEPTLDMVDGVPDDHWPRAEIVDYPLRTRLADGLKVVANARWGAECELLVHPVNAITPPPPAIVIAPETGQVEWEVKLNPKYRGKSIEIEVLSRPSALYRASSARRRVDIVGGKDGVQ